jgi:integral membrane sensor domain MASE1
MDSTPSRTSGAWSTFAALAVAYLAAGIVSRSLASAQTHTVPVWLAAGVAVGVLRVVGPGQWLGALLGTAAGAYVWGLTGHALGAWGAVPFAAIETVAVGIGAWVARWAGGAPAQRRGPSLVWLLLGTALTAGIGATLAAEYWRHATPEAAYADEWRAWAFSTALGILLLAPVIDAFRSFRVRRSGGMPSAQFAAGALAFAVFLVVAWLSFGAGAHRRFGALIPTLAYLPMPFLLLAALLWGPIGGSVGTLLGGVLLIAWTAAGHGPFAVADGFPGEAVIEVQAYVALWVVLILLVQELSAARRQALAQARDYQLRYERTLEATGVASAEFDAVTGAAVWSRQAQAVLGPGIDTIANVGDWLAGIQPPDRALAEASWRQVVDGRLAGTSDGYPIRLAGRILRVQTQWAAVRGPDGRTESVAALMRRIDAAPAAPDFRAGGLTHG